MSAVSSSPVLYSPTRKPWGTSEICFRDDHLLVMRIVVLPGGFCSKHYHARMHNSFVLVKGRLEIVEFLVNGGSEWKREVLAVGNDFFTVAPHQIHRFECGADEGAIAYEVYRAAEAGCIVDEADIERLADGGRR